MTSQGSSSEPSMDAKVLSWSPESLSGPSARAASSHASTTTGAASVGRASVELFRSRLMRPLRLPIVRYSVSLSVVLGLMVLGSVAFGLIRTGINCGVSDFCFGSGGGGSVVLVGAAVAPMVMDWSLGTSGSRSICA